MKKSVGLLLLLVCYAPTIFATKKTSIKIALVKFYSNIPNTKELSDKFFDETIRPLTPYWLIQDYHDPHAKKRDIYQTLYRIAHPDAPPVKDPSFEYPKTVSFLCQRDFFESLTSDAKDVYLSVLADYATELRGKVEYENQINYASENIPQEKRLELWKILARKIKFTPEFAAITDGDTIKKTFENTLFSILCRDREEAALLPQNLPDGPLKIYLETVLLKRPTALENLVQVLYQLGMSTTPQWTAEQAAAAIGLARLTEGKEKVVEEKKVEQPKEQTKVEEKKKEEKVETKVEEKKPEQTKAAETKKTSLWQWLFPPKTAEPEKEPVKKEEEKIEEKEINYPEPPVSEEGKLVTLEEIIKQEKAKGGWHVSDYLPSWPFSKKTKEKPAPPPVKIEEIKEKIKAKEPGETKENLEQPEEQTVIEAEEDSEEPGEIKENLEQPEEQTIIETEEDSSKTSEELEKERQEKPNAFTGLEGFI